MSEPTPFLMALGRQTLVLSLALPLLLALRRPLLRRFGASVAYASWLLLPLLMLAAWLPASAPVQALRATVVARIEPLLAMPAATLPEVSAPWWPATLAAVWILGALLCAARLAWLQRRYMQDLTLAGDGSQWHSPTGSGPALVGLLRPRLALPADFGQRFDALQQSLVLAHEEVHRERRDNHWNAIAALLCLLHWFNPFAWLALRRMRADQELACDAAVLARHPGSEAAYGRALLLAQGPQFATGLPWASWQSTHPLIERIEMLKQHNGPAARRKFGLALLTLLAVAGTGTVHALRADAAPETGGGIVLRMEIANTTEAGTTRSQPTIRVNAGQPAQVILNGSPSKPTPDQLSIELIAEDLGDGKIKISADIKKGDSLVSFAKPRIVTQDGVKALIEIGQGVGYGKDADKPGGEKLSISITPSLLGKPKPDGAKKGA